MFSCDMAETPVPATVGLLCENIRYKAQTSFELCLIMIRFGPAIGLVIFGSNLRSFSFWLIFNKNTKAGGTDTFEQFR